MIIPVLRDWRRGSNLYDSTHHQEPVDALRKLSASVENRLVGENWAYHESFLAILVDEGPDGQADPTGETYWFKEQFVEKAAAPATSPITTDDDTMYAAAKESPGDPAPTPRTAIATNIDEIREHTHGLNTEGEEVVWVHAIYDRANPQEKRYWFSRGLPRTHFTATVGSGSQDGSNKRWSYPFTEVEKTAGGYSGWTTKSGGLTGTAYNRIEYINGASGLYGNGVDSANLLGTFDIQKCPSGVPVEIAVVKLTTGATEYWFSYENAVDGACEEP